MAREASAIADGSAAGPSAAKPPSVANPSITANPSIAANPSSAVDPSNAVNSSSAVNLPSTASPDWRPLTEARAPESDRVATRDDDAYRYVNAATQARARIEDWFNQFVGLYSNRSASFVCAVPNVAACLAAISQWIDVPNAHRPSESIARIVRSTALLRAVLSCRKHAIPGDQYMAEQLEIAYLATLRKACLAGVVEAGSVLEILLGHQGDVAACVDAERCVDAFARHLTLVRTCSWDEAYEFCGAVDAALRTGQWKEGEPGTRAKWRRELLLCKGFGPDRRNNFYSAIAFGKARADMTALLAAARAYDLLPNEAQCLEKHSRRRGRALAESLGVRKPQPLPQAVIDSAGDDTRSATWLAGFVEDSLSDSALESTRDRYASLEEACHRQVDMMAWNLNALGLGP